MLTFLSIRNYTLIESTDLEIRPELSVITGETGAGKSIIIGALGLLTGKRAHADTVRPGASQADILAIFDITINPALKEWLKERDMLNEHSERDNGASHPEEQCLIRRVVTQEGRSRSYINGRLVTLSDMKKVSETILSIHGQHQNQMLLKKEYQLSLLDQFAGTTELQNTLQSTCHAHQSILRKIKDLTTTESHIAAKKELLEYQVSELNALSIQEGEYERIEEQHQKLANADHLADLCNQIYLQLSSEDNLSNPIQRATSSLKAYTNADPALKEVYSMLSNADILLNEAASTLNQYIESIECDPQALQAAEARLSSLHALARKHDIPAKALHKKLTELSNELQTLINSHQTIPALQAEADQLYVKIQSIADRLTDKRNAAIPLLETKVTEQIKQLGLPKAHFKIALINTEKGVSIYGNETIEFMISTNPGLPENPIRKVASGGELSRISLAIQVICSTKELRPPTMIFDEVDVGVGGAVAESVGRLLRQLGEQGQVICITHLAQVASQGHHHIHVTKVHDEKRTYTEIESLSTDQKVLEIARMLGGIEISDHTITHAKEMINRSNEGAA